MTQTHGADDAGSTLTEGLLCPDCGYDLRGLPEMRCPECGLSVESLIAEPGIPWVRRRKLGWFRAYWRTVWTVMFCHRRFAREVMRPVSCGDARRFRRLTIAHAYSPVLIWLGILWCVWPCEVEPAIDYYGWPLIVLLLACGLAFVAVATVIPSYFFRPRGLSIELQNRMVALSYYACAPLAWSPLLLIPGCLALYAQVVKWDDRFWFQIADVLVLLLFILFWLSAVGLTRHLLRRHVATLRIAVALPVLWVLAAALILFILPAALAYPFIIFFSWR